MAAFFSSTPKVELVDLKGKVAIVTGGNSGIGYSTVQILARHGAKVYMAARNESKATGAIAQLEAEGLGPGNGKVEYLNLDLSDPRNAKKAAEEVLKKEERLDILINNAAIVGVLFQFTGDGLSEIMVTNYLSHYVFTDTLLPLLKKTAAQPGADVRIVNVSSTAHTMIDSKSDAPPRFDTKEAFNRKYDDTWLGMLKRYGFSKLAQILHSKYLQSQFDAASIPIICLSVHPGGIQTPGVMNGTIYYPFYIKGLFWILNTFFFKPVIHGGSGVAFAAASVAVAKDRAKYGGAYLVPIGKIDPGSKSSREEALVGELHNTTEGILKEMGLSAA
ncbi:NAD(P)-binding protein [Sistotremastrum suecicum HHB10207 ss-3]|uniref:NAD(P)-binding protein n=1 Tax=Sistotremastrum suecicum HHB10207 ss-3 TaxID=1314776 RepID=A0A165ZUQ0_9AGAM|nr:NAD(P)-binding protein [Sistotremastrum suecicum HHB10207 ss-3]